MEIRQLTILMNEFVMSKGWYKVESSRPQSLKNLAISLSLEASEVLEHFQWAETTPDSIALADELADVALYLLQMASVAEIDLEKAILNKLDKNIYRKW